MGKKSFGDTWSYTDLSEIFLYSNTDRLELSDTLLFGNYAIAITCTTPTVTTNHAIASIHASTSFMLLRLQMPLSLIVSLSMYTLLLLLYLLSYISYVSQLYTVTTIASTVMHVTKQHIVPSTTINASATFSLSVFIVY